MLPKIPGLKIIFFHPGRVKVRIDSLIGNRPLGVQTAKDLSANNAISKIAVDPAKGDALIQYDRKLIKESIIMNHSRRHSKNYFPSWILRHYAVNC